MVELVRQQEITFEIGRIQERNNRVNLYKSKIGKRTRLNQPCGKLSKIL
jgi:hypothetical protein